MTQALWIAKTGLDAQQTRMAVISNNLSNVNTTGFKRDRAEFQDLLYQTVRQPGGATSEQTQSPTGLSTGTGVRVAATAKEFSQGNLNVTNGALDVGIDGRGFFEVLMPDGSSAYTRDGSFKRSPQGELVTSSGYPVQPGIQQFFGRSESWGQIMAYATVVTLPVLAVFLAFQRQFVASVVGSGIKG